MPQYSFAQHCQALAATPLLFPDCFAEPPLFRPQFNFSNAREAPLPRVFGKRMERLFSQIVKASDRYRLLAENLQVISGGHTLGELDFIISDRETQDLLHVEMACKFYLYRPGTDERPLLPWIGPNLKDRLEDKLDKLRQRQFPLLYRQETRQHLNDLGIDHLKLKQRLYLPGLLFTPLGFAENLPVVNSRALAGHFYHYPEFERHQPADALYHLPEKRNWLIPPQWNRQWKSLEDILPELQEYLGRRRSPMLWVKLAAEKYQRAFVVWW